jgi:hypothetical protein
VSSRDSLRRERSLAAFSSRSKTALKAALSTICSLFADLDGALESTLAGVGFHEMGCWEFI